MFNIIFRCFMYRVCSKQLYSFNGNGGIFFYYIFQQYSERHFFGTINVMQDENCASTFKTTLKF